MMRDGLFSETSEEKEVKKLRAKLEEEYSLMKNPAMSKEYYISSNLAQYYRNKYILKPNEVVYDKVNATSDAIVYINNYYDVIYSSCYSDNNYVFYQNILNLITSNFGNNLDSKSIKSKLSEYNIRNYNKLNDIFVSIILFTSMIFACAAFFTTDLISCSLMIFTVVSLILLSPLVSIKLAKFYSTPKRPDNIWD